MKVEISFENFSNICEGCLSLDRVLQFTLDPDIMRYFQSIVQPLPCFSETTHVDHPLGLCWECVANIRKTLKYQNQVKYAHGTLVRYMLRQTTTLPCLSRFTTSTPHIEDIHPSPHTVDSLPITETEPLAFIKVEEQEGDEFGEDIEGYFVDDVGTEDAVDDTDLKAILKTNLITKEEKPAKRSRAKRNHKTEVEFDESDDEPLKKRTEDTLGKVGDKVELAHEFKTRGRKKKKAGSEEELKKNTEDKAEKVGDAVKPRGKRKKKGDSEPAGTKKPGGRREKPAGVVTNARVTRKLQRLNVPPGQVEMLVLTWEQVEEQRQKALQSTAYTNASHRCERCAVGFNHRAKLEAHQRKHAAGALPCGACGVRAAHTRTLAAHRRRHRLRWRCTICGDMSSRAEVAADHVVRAHGTTTVTHACTRCEHVAPSLAKLRQHLREHQAAVHCQMCGKLFRDRASLRTHLFIHKGEKEYSCPRCGKQFLFKKAMELHLVTHDASAHLYCHQCDVNFKNRMSYYQHMRYSLRHASPARLRHACALCPKRFAKAARLREHHVAVHLKATPVGCTVQGCNFACSSRPVLRTHIRMVHRNFKAVKNHVCHTCGKAYSTKKTLEGHMRTHTGERPFTCALCPSTFAYEAALYNHNKLVHLKPKGGRRAPAWPAPAVTAPEPTQPT